MIVNVGFKFGQFVIHIVMTFYRFVLQSQASLATLDNTSNIDKLWSQYDNTIESNTTKVHRSIRH